MRGLWILPIAVVVGLASLAVCALAAPASTFTPAGPVSTATPVPTIGLLASEPRLGQIELVAGGEGSHVRYAQDPRSFASSGMQPPGDGWLSPSAWRFVDGESCIGSAPCRVGRCVAMVDDAEYEELMARKAALPKTRFGDGYEPEHMERIERLTRSF